MRATSPRPGFTLVITAMLGVSLLFSGCTSTRFHTPSAGANLSAEVRVGDQINCQMNDGTQKAFTVCHARKRNNKCTSSAVHTCHFTALAECPRK